MGCCDTKDKSKSNVRGHPSYRPSIHESIQCDLSEEDENIDDTNMTKEINKNNKLTYRADLSFIPQIEIQFSEVKDITEDLIDDLILKLDQLFQRKDVKIIEMKKGSLDIVIALNYLIKEGLRNINIHNFSVDQLLETLNHKLQIETTNVKNTIQNNLVIGTKNQTFRPDYINQNILDLTTQESKDRLS